MLLWASDAESVVCVSEVQVRGEPAAASNDARIDLVWEALRTGLADLRAVSPR